MANSGANMLGYLSRGGLWSVTFVFIKIIVLVYSYQIQCLHPWQTLTR